ncbi:MAG: TolC family protein [Nitrospirae bacterium]|nr:TolC family protein [Nitrospirota bacterium]
MRLYAKIQMANMALLSSMVLAILFLPAWLYAKDTPKADTDADFQRHSDMALVQKVEECGPDCAKAISMGETLFLERCIDLAIKNQPSIIAAAYTVMANQSKIGQAGAGNYPQMDLSSSYSRYQPTTGGMSVPPTGLNQYTSSATIKQNIYDFGRVKTQVKIQELNAESSLYDLSNTTAQIVYNVKQAYYTLLQAGRNREVALETVMQFQQHLQQAIGFYSVGERAKFDVTKAEVDLSNAKLSMIKADNALRLARVNLNNAMGVPDAPEYLVQDNLMFKRYDVSLDKIIETAFNNRADLQSIKTKQAAARQTIELRKKDYYPTVQGSAGYSWGGESFAINGGWNIGAQVSISIFSGYLTKKQIEEAQLNLNVLKANEETIKQGIIVEVQQGYLNLKEAEERITATAVTVRQAKENLDLANGRYAAGVGNPIEVTDADVTYSNANTAHIQALTDYKIAQASIEKAMGERR